MGFLSVQAGASDIPVEQPNLSKTRRAVPVATARVRDLVHELARIQDQLTAEDHATGARPSPGSTRRRAQLLRRERDVIRQLRIQDNHHNGDHIT
ncbi:MAG: hypothetical protein WAV52_13745 [Luteococcus japonicus]